MSLPQSWVDDFTTDNFANGRYKHYENPLSGISVGGGSLSLVPGVPPMAIGWQDPNGVVPDDWELVQAWGVIGRSPSGADWGSWMWNLEVGFEAPGFEFAGSFQVIVNTASWWPPYRLHGGALSFFTSDPYVDVSPSAASSPLWNSMPEPVKIRLTIARTGLVLAEIGVGAVGRHSSFLATDGWATGDSAEHFPKMVFAANASDAVLAQLAGKMPFGFLSGNSPPPFHEWGWLVTGSGGAPPAAALQGSVGAGGMVRSVGGAVVGAGVGDRLLVGQ